MKIFGFEISRIKEKEKVRKRYFTATKTNNLTADWILPHRLSYDEILKYSLAKLRERSRDIERNDSYFRNFLRKLEANVIGAKGVILQSKVYYKVIGDLDIKTNKMIEDAWDKWSKRYASVCGELTLRDIAKLVLRSVARDGECFIRLVRGYDNPFGFALQVLEAEQVDDMYNGTNNGNRIIMGIEKDEFGKPVAYYVFKYHPGERGVTGNERIRIPADEIIHIYIKERASQTRGIPWGVAAIMKLRMLSAYEEAEVIAARISASKMGFFTEAPEGVNYISEVDEETGELITEVQPGILEKLPPGVDFKPFDPGSPNSEFGDFVKAMLKGISSALGCSYNTLCNDLESVNYSSIRAGTIEEREYYKDIQQWFIDSFYEKIYPVWLEMADLSGQIKINREEFERYLNVEWQARRWDWVDPQKDVMAKVLELKNGLTTRTRILAEKGIDFEDILEELKREKQLAEKYGIELKDVDNKITEILFIDNENVEKE